MTPFLEKFIDFVNAATKDAAGVFWNWVDMIYNQHLRTQKAFIISGPNGMGKGLLTHVLEELFLDKKRAYTAHIKPKDITKDFNIGLRDTLLCVCDENDDGTLNTD
jgi:pantothenate kinase-related protein Tda10